MLIFKNNSLYYIFIHIPKNGGKYIRNNILNDANNVIIKSYWGCDGKTNLDEAHIPYIKRIPFINTSIEYNYFTYTRNPYDRLISAYFYVNLGKNKNIEDFRNFIKNKLKSYDFNNTVYNRNFIHFYPQYLFICDENLNISPNIQLRKFENEKHYNISEYFDNICIEIVNNIYQQDFLLGYPIINGV